MSGQVTSSQSRVTTETRVRRNDVGSRLKDRWLARMSSALDPDRLAQPPGKRSCWSNVADEIPGEGGQWHLARERATGAAPWWATDYRTTIDRFEGQPRTMLQAEIKSKLKRATEGRLHYGEGAEFDVEQMSVAPTVLELRLSAQFGDDPTVRLHTRVYFNEPDQVPGALRLLSLQCKHDGEPGVKEQNQHALEAAVRLKGCEFTPLNPPRS